MNCALCLRHQLDGRSFDSVNAAVTVYNGMALCVDHLIEVSRTYDPMPGEMPTGKMN